MCPEDNENVTGSRTEMSEKKKEKTFDTYLTDCYKKKIYLWRNYQEGRRWLSKIQEAPGVLSQLCLVKSTGVYFIIGGSLCTERSRAHTWRCWDRKLEGIFAVPPPQTVKYFPTVRLATWIRGGCYFALLQNAQCINLSPSGEAGWTQLCNDQTWT